MRSRGVLHYFPLLLRVRLFGNGHLQAGVWLQLWSVHEVPGEAGGGRPDGGVVWGEDCGAGCSDAPCVTEQLQRARYVRLFSIPEGTQPGRR